MPTNVFISYSTRDIDTAQAICSALEAAGISCWMAPRDILPGQTWTEAIIDGINGCQVMVLLYTSASNASPQVLREVERAVSKNLGLIAFRAEDVAPSKAMEYLVSVSHWLEAHTGSLDDHLPTLVQSVQSLLTTRRGGEPTFSPVLAAPPAHPMAPPLPSHNLPAPLTSFVGRDQPLQQVKQLLSSSRLVTLVGTGGVGKTRLALKVAEEMLPLFADGVWLVELAALTAGSLVVSKVAQVLEVKEQPGQSVEQTLLAFLKEKRLLLLLDNCEHLLVACARLSASVLRSCPHLRLLATSREALGITGEQTYRVPSLSLPECNQAVVADTLNQYEAVRLFIDRAVLCKPDFAVTNQSAPALAQVCHRLDGIPLAIELAAARVRALPVEEINTRLDNRFRLLTGGDRTALPRQQTLRALMDWSYDLLNPQEKTLLNRLSVFAGGWTLEAAETVCAGEEIEEFEVLDLLLFLVDKSLVIYEEKGGQARYRMLETIRQYARDRLREVGKEMILRRQHQEYFLAVAEKANPKLVGSEQAHWLEVLEIEHDNLRQTLTFCLEEAGREEVGLCLGAILQQFWGIRGYLTEGRERLMALLSHPLAQEQTKARAEPLNGAGVLAWHQGDFTAAKTFHEESLAIRRELEDKPCIAKSLHDLGNVIYNQGDYAAAKALFEESLASSRELGDRRGIATSLNSLGIIAWCQGDYGAARSLYAESLAIKRLLGDKRGVSTSLNNLGLIASDQGDYMTAKTLHEESLAIKRELDDRQGIAISLSNLGEVAESQGNNEAAKTHFQESLAIQRELGDTWGIACSLNNLGLVACAQGDYASARTLFEQGLAIHRELGDKRSIAYSLRYLGCATASQRDHDSARTLFEQGLAIHRELGDKRGIAYSLEAFASLAAKEERLERSVRLFGAAEMLREEIGVPIPLNEREDYDRQVSTARQALGEEAFSKAWAEGREMPPGEAIEYALQETGASNV